MNTLTNKEIGILKDVFYVFEDMYSSDEEEIVIAREAMNVLAKLMEVLNE